MVTFIETIVYYTFASFGNSAVPFLNLPFQLMLTPLAFMERNVFIVRYFRFNIV